MSGTVYFADCLEALKTLPSESVQLVVTDPPFNTGAVQEDNFSGIAYLDSKFDYIKWMHDIIKECHRILTPDGSIYVHLGEKISYKVRLLVMDKIFGEKNWLNTIIWDFDFGGRSKKTFARKHETILYYAKNLKNYTFHHDMVDRVPYMAPGLAGPEKAALGKAITDVWWCTVCPTNGTERVHYPNQKPIKLYERMIRVSSNPGDVILDPFAGSGTTLVAAHRHGRNWIGIDNSEAAIRVMQGRFIKDGVDDYNIMGLPVPALPPSIIEADMLNGICGAQSPGDENDEDDPPVTCSSEPEHAGDHEGGTRCGTVSWPRVESESR